MWAEIGGGAVSVLIDGLEMLQTWIGLLRALEERSIVGSGDRERFFSLDGLGGGERGWGVAKVEVVNFRGENWRRILAKLWQKCLISLGFASDSRICPRRRADGKMAGFKKIHAVLTQAAKQVREITFTLVIHSPLIS